MSDKNLIFAAAHVAHRAPQEWANFISALDAYAAGKRDECIRSPLDMLQVTQGRAQASRDLYDLISNAVKAANQIETRQTQKPHQPR